MARLISHMTQESPQQTTQAPGPPRTRAVQPATGHTRLSLLWAGTPNYSSDKHVSFVHPSLFSIPGTFQLTPGIILIPGASFQTPRGISPLFSSPLCRPISPISYHLSQSINLIIISSPLCRPISPISYHLFQSSSHHYLTPLL